jgi:hypothetical protein
LDLADSKEQASIPQQMAMPLSVRLEKRLALTTGVALVAVMLEAVLGT